MICKNCIKTFTCLTKLKIIKSSVISNFSRLSSTTSDKNLIEWSNVKSKYTDKQLTVILKTLNKCNLKELKRFNIAENHIEILESLKKQRKPSKTLDDLIALNTFQVSELENICSSISSDKKLKIKPSIVTPPIKVSDLEKINTAVGLRISSNYISWSQLELTGSHCKILKWHSQSVSDLPLNASPAEVIKAGISIAESIPIADAYVMEKESSKPLASVNTSIYRVLLRQQQLIAIILTALSSKYKSEQMLDDKDIFNKFYTMKAYAPAKLFKLLVGSEIVSPSATVKCLFDQKYPGLQYILSLSSDREVLESYESLNLRGKEEANMNLLLTITFFELAVLQTKNDLYRKANNS